MGWSGLGTEAGSLYYNKCNAYHFIHQLSSDICFSFIPLYFRPQQDIVHTRVGGAAVRDDSDT